MPLLISVTGTVIAHGAISLNREIIRSRIAYELIIIHVIMISAVRMSRGRGDYVTKCTRTMEADAL